MSQRSHSDFQSLFREAFFIPQLQSERFIQTFQHLEGLNDLLAGPLFSIYENGHCDYVFIDKSRFPDIHSIDDFFERNKKLIQEYREHFEQLQPLIEGEQEDWNLILFQLDKKIEASELASELLARKLTLE